MAHTSGIPLHHEYIELCRHLMAHAERYPQARFQDLAKLLYQAELGPGHMIDDPDACLQRLIDEWRGCEKTEDGPRFEAIGGGFFRAHLGGFQEAQLPKLCRFFMEAAAYPVGSKAALIPKLGIALDLCRKGRLPLSHRRARSWLMRYRQAGLPAVSHSARFRKAYSPAYRVVSAACVAWFADNQK